LPPVICRDSGTSGRFSTLLSSLAALEDAERSRAEECSTVATADHCVRQYTFPSAPRR